MRRSCDVELVDSILARWLAKSTSLDLDIVSTAECIGGPNSGDHHESTTVTHRYVEAELAVKKNAFARLEAPNTKVRRFRAPDSLMGFL